MGNLGVLILCGWMMKAARSREKKSFPSFFAREVESLEAEKKACPPAVEAFG